MTTDATSRNAGPGTDGPAGETARLVRALRRDLRRHGPGFVVRKSAGTIWRWYHMRKYRFNLRRLTRPLESVRIDRPIFVLGTQGCGGTVLCRCLHRHPQTVYASGNSDFWTGHDEIHNRRPVMDDLPDDLQHRSYHFRNVDGRLENHELFGYQRAWLYATDELLPTFRRTAEDVDEAATEKFKSALRRIILAYAHNPDDCRFVDKSQLFTVQVPYIARMLEGADPHFVVVARNPYAACSRAVGKEYEPRSGSRLATDRKARIRLAVQHWSNSYRLALAAKASVPLIRVRYEDFLEDPAAVVREICEFAGLRFHQDQIPAVGQKLPFGGVVDHKWYPLRRAENDKYLDDIDPELKRAVTEQASDLLDAFGYGRLA